jgi:hypothetical protein
MATCPNHEGRPVHAKGLCRGCYDSQRRIGLNNPGEAARAEQASCHVDRERGEATIVSDPRPLDDGSLDELIRENGLDPDDWVVVTTTLNRYEMLGRADPATGENPVRTLRQVKVTLKLKSHLLLRAPVVHVPELVKPAARVAVSVDEPDLILVEGDHQAPYHDPRLDAIVTRVTAELRPVEHVFLGDTGDYPTISKHADHPAAMAPVREVDEAVYGILRRRAEASPDTKRKKLKGNHDWRTEQELLLRAERLYDRVPVGEDDPVWSLRRVLHLDRLGIELVEDRRGWQHAEVVLVPGMHGLVVRHGWLTGANSVEKTLEKRGRSIIFGHIHTRKQIFRWNATAEIEQQATSIGAMCLVRDERFPHFSPCDGWAQGAATVTRWRDGRWKIEHMEYADGALTWRDRRWGAE